MESHGVPWPPGSPMGPMESYGSHGYHVVPWIPMDCHWSHWVPCSPMGPLESHGSHTAPTTRCLLPQGAAKGSILGGSQHLGGLLLNGDMTLKTHNAVKKVVPIFSKSIHTATNLSSFCCSTPKQKELKFVARLTDGTNAQH